MMGGVVDYDSLTRSHLLQRLSVGLFLFLCNILEQICLEIRRNNETKWINNYPFRFL